MNTKPTINQCLAEYSINELIQFHANLNALFTCCNQDFHLFPLLMAVHVELATRKEPIAKKYLTAITKLLEVS